MSDLSAPSNTSRNWGVGRFLAPLALLAVLVAAFVVVTGSLEEDGSGTSGAEVEATTGVNGGGDGVEGDGAENPKTYVVESGDVLSQIAEQFGVSVERLIRLNPDVDPNTLNAGVEIKIR